MAKFDLKKAILENKATFHSSLTEGQFSWFTQDTNQQIGSEDENTLPFVYMHDNKGNKWLEKRYEGYGVFGGKDYYELLDQMNGGSGDRSEGIRLAFDDAAVAAGKVLFPALTVSATLSRFHDFTEESPNDPNQSWYTPEEDDDDYITGDRDDEYLQEAMDVAKDMTDQETAGVAERFAKYMSDKEGGEFTVTMGSVEGPSFDLDLNGEKYDGGSYIILTNGDIVNMALPDKPVYGNMLMMKEAEKPTTKMKKSELKDKIKEMVLSEMEKDVNISDETPENEEDFLAEIEAMLAEADEEAPAEDAAAEDAPAEDETAVDDAEVAVDGEENIEVDTTAEVDPNVKAVQDSLTQAQAAAQKLGDAKLTDQIGNTITFFTRSHVVDKGAVAEGEEMEENEFQPLFKSIRDLPIVDFQRKQFDQLNDLYNAYLVKYADSKGDNGSQMSPNELNRKYGEEIRSELGVDSIRTADIATALIKAGLIKVNKGVEGEEMEEGKKEYYNDAESDDAAHINALEKDMKDDKDSSMKIKEVVFPMWQRIK